MPNIFDLAQKSIDDFDTKKAVYDPYFFFEPWDCEIPHPEVFRSAREDGVDLVEDPAARLAGPYPRPFQTGSVLSTKKMVVTQAGSRSGKTICTQVVIGAMVSRRPPHAFRYAKGEDTGILRIVNEHNIERFGRQDIKTGEVIDRNTKAKEDGTWNCGNIRGAGKFPEELFAPHGAQIWIGTIAKSVDTMWKPSFIGAGENRFFPQEFIDTSKGNKGYNWQQGIIHCLNDIDIHLKTYEQGHTKFESQTAWMLAYDEEPPKDSIYHSGAAHAIYQRFSFTPLNGKTWSEDVFFSCLKDEEGKGKGKGKGKNKGLLRTDFDYFYATQYDSPYVPLEKLQRDRRGMEVWQRKMRVWGQYSEHEGMPFFNRSKIQAWARKYVPEFRLARFVPRVAFHGMNGSKVDNKPGILQIRVDSVTVREEDEKDTWHVFENVEEGVGYLAIFDAAEGAVDLEEVQDRSFGLIVRKPQPKEIEFDNLPVVVAACRSTLPTVAFAKACLPVLRHYNNALLAAERGHGKDNEGFGITLEDWPYWYYYAATSNATKRLRPKKGFDTNSHTRTAMFDKLRAWMDEYEEDKDPHIRDPWLYKELAGAIVKETQGGKKRCDHTKKGSLDGAICLGIGTYIIQETPGVIVCNYHPEDNRRDRVGLMQRVLGSDPETPKHISMGAGVAGVGGR